MLRQESTIEGEHEGIIDKAAAVNLRGVCVDVV